MLAADFSSGAREGRRASQSDEPVKLIAGHLYCAFYGAFDSDVYSDAQQRCLG
jgi:hypothetical protein